MFEPTTPIQAMQTFSIAAPLATHFRPATCAEYECDPYRLGWVSRIDESTELGQTQARYIRHGSGRGFTEERDEAGITVFRFHPGQQPFDDAQGSHRQHQVRVDRPELFVVRDGDVARGNPTGRVTRHSGPQPWLDQFGEHLEKLSDQTKRG